MPVPPTRTERALTNLRLHRMGAQMAEAIGPEHAATLMAALIDERAEHRSEVLELRAQVRALLLRLESVEAAHARDRAELDELHAGIRADRLPPIPRDQLPLFDAERDLIILP